MAEKLSRAQRREALDRALNSSLFERAPKLRQLLSYIGEQSLADHPEALTEREIGHAVFGRVEHYDSGDDNIVRVQMRNLRGRLERYYREEDPTSETLIRIPKGHYIPEFVYRGEERSSERPIKPTTFFSWRSWVFAGCAVALAFWLGLNSHQLSHGGGEAALAWAPHGLWDPLFNSPEEVLVVMPDTTFALSQRLRGESSDLQEYLAAGVEEMGRARAAVPLDETKPYADALRHITWREQTDFGDVMFIEELANLVQGRHFHFTVGFPRRLHSSDFKGRNVIFLGSSRANPWVELLETEMNFVFHYDDETETPYFVNRKPAAAEPDEYRRGGPSGDANETYALIALKSNISGEGLALVVAGLDDAGSDAARDLLFGDSLFGQLTRELGLLDGDPLPHFEAILKASRIVGSGSGEEIVAIRAASLKLAHP